MLASHRLNLCRQICERTIRVDHVSQYKQPKEKEEDEEEAKGNPNEMPLGKVPNAPLVCKFVEGCL